MFPPTRTSTIAWSILLHAQLCAHLRLQRPRPVLRHLRPLRRPGQIPHRRLARRGRHPRRRAEPAVPRTHGHTHLHRRRQTRRPHRLANDTRRPSPKPHRRRHRNLPRGARPSPRYASSPPAFATRSPPIAKSSTTPSPCAQPASNTAASPTPRSACAVKIRFLYQVLRAFPPQQVFAQTLLGFEVASRRIPASSASTSSSPKTPISPWASTTGRCSCSTTSTPSTPASTSACTPASSPPASSRPTASASTSARPSTSATPNASATASTSCTKTDPQALLKEMARTPRHGRDQPHLQRRHPRRHRHPCILCRAIAPPTSPSPFPPTTKASPASTSPTSTPAPPSTSICTYVDLKTSGPHQPRAQLPLPALASGRNPTSSLKPPPHRRPTPGRNQPHTQMPHLPKEQRKGHPAVGVGASLRCL